MLAVAESPVQAGYSRASGYCQVCVLQPGVEATRFACTETDAKGAIVIRLIAALLLILLLVLPGVARADAASALAGALKAVARQDWPGAAVAAQVAGPVAADLVEWHRLRAGDGAARDYAAFVARRPDWPGLPLLLEKGEYAVAAAGVDAIIAYFAGHAPQTGVGALALARAYRATGQTALAEAEAERAWLDLPMAAADQAGLVAEFGAVLAPLHTRRLDAMIWAGHSADAARMLDLVPPGWRASAAARLALLAGQDGVDALVAAVPAEFAGGAGLAYARMVWRMDRGLTDDAADLMVERSASAKALGQPEAWADARATLVRRDLRDGNDTRAYRLAAGHRLDPVAGNADYADLEWLAGYVALRRLGDGERALGHFQNLRLAARSEITIGRAGYWEGRANEALGRPDAARAAYSYAARHQTGFYGLLAAEKAGVAMNPALAGGDRYPDWAGAGFMQSSVLQAALLLQKAESRSLAARFFLHLAETQGPVELGQMADLALSLGEPYIALKLAKQAAEQGVILNRAYYPVTGLADMELPVPTELALAIARRESEFDPAAVSAAGARGLMQVMPATAKLIAPRAGLQYLPELLGSDATYNARLGATYLAQLRSEFGSSPLLVAAGYNAGPGRPRKWIEDFGDPRDPGVDPVDWIEAIPFAETRTYVMRVAESMLIYRARLAGGPVEIRLSAELKGR